MSVCIHGNLCREIYTKTGFIYSSKCPSNCPYFEEKYNKGHWILADGQNKDGNYRFICSECQYSDIHAKGTIVPYCWKCGAKMEG